MSVMTVKMKILIFTRLIRITGFVLLKVSRAQSDLTKLELPEDLSWLDCNFMKESDIVLSSTKSFI